MSFILIAILTVITTIYDILTYPLYYLLQKPWVRLKDAKVPKMAQATLIDRTENSVTYHTTRVPSPLRTLLEDKKIDTMDKLYSYSLNQYASKDCLGVREMLGEEEEVQADGKIFKKYRLGNYMWKSCREVDAIAVAFAKGLRSLGVPVRGKICIFAETRAEWLMSAIAAFRQSIAIVTLYATLGDEAVIHGVVQTEVDVIVTSHELLPKFRTILKDCPNVKRIIYMEDQLAKTDTSGFLAHVVIQSFCEVVEMGRRASFEPSPPSAEDLAIIMYTSGSTGVPKGVELTHKNVIGGMAGMADAGQPWLPEDVFIAYLPLAHVMELTFESVVFANGCRIGYSSALTMTDTSGKIPLGGKGDATLLQPTIMPMVPLILDRIYKGVQERVRQGGPTKSAVFKFFYNYKLKWFKRGFTCPLTNRLIFKQVQAMVGGRVRYMPGGGAPLSPDTQEFCRNVLNVNVLTGYGLTETCASGTVTLKSDMSNGRVGQCLAQVEMRLIDWEEGNYRVSDKPYPRGEIVLGGNTVGRGYYKMPEQTEQDFFQEGEIRWFRTGDIGTIESDGGVRIIDRKKDLVKLQFGEYVSLGKVEAGLKTCPWIDNICVVADGTKSFCVALAVPLEPKLNALASTLGKNGLSFEQMCQDKTITATALKELQDHGRKMKLAKFEIPAALKLCSELWTPDSGLVTAAFKLKRRPIQDFYEAEIRRLYSTDSNNN